MRPAVASLSVRAKLEPSTVPPYATRAHKDRPRRQTLGLLPLLSPVAGTSAEARAEPVPGPWVITIERSIDGKYFKVSPSLSVTIAWDNLQHRHGRLTNECCFLAPDLLFLLFLLFLLC
jgi:hypothetical protein